LRLVEGYFDCRALGAHMLEEGAERSGSKVTLYL